MEIKKNWDLFIQNLDKYKVGGSPARDILIKLTYFLVLLFVIPLLFSTEKSFKYTDMKVGSIATKKVVAPYNFFVLKTKDELKEERKSAIEVVPYYFVYDDSITAKVKYVTDNLIPFLQRKKPNGNIENLVNLQESENPLIQIQAGAKRQFNINITTTNLMVLYDILNNTANKYEFQGILKNAAGDIKAGIININLKDVIRPNIVILKNGVEESLPENSRTDMLSFKQELEVIAQKKFDPNQATVINYLLNQIIQPNLIYNEALTKRAENEAFNSVSLTKDMVYENERIVDANERINAEIYQKLYSLEVSEVERSNQEGNWQILFAFLGKLMLLGAVLFIVGLYLFSYRKKIFADNKKLLMISMIILIQMVLAAVISGPLNWPAYLIPTTITSMLLAILIDSGIGFVGTVAVALILGGIQGGGYDIALITVVSGMIGIYSVHHIRNRNQIFNAILFITIAYLWVIIALSALRFDSYPEIAKIFLYNLLPNAVFSPFIAFMILGLFERMFDITTDVTLLELSDLNHPLLKKLSMQAPGTFHHSMVVGNLAESAAKAIGANSLLARVGSYYHDIGKMEKPEYFVENQMDAENRHSKLSPNMSALILASHVKNGIDMAKKYNIPKLIRDFIPEHHGTNIMTYFYQKALDSASDKDEIYASDFKYPGPKPQSKETAIVMIADAVEAATRTIRNPTPSKFRSFIETLADQRFQDGELDESNLTFKELKMIIDAFMPVLSGVFQHRVDYPESDKTKGPGKSNNQKEEKEKVAKNGNSNTPAQS